MLTGQFCTRSTRGSTTTINPQLPEIGMEIFIKISKSSRSKIKVLAASSPNCETLSSLRMERMPGAGV
jgi:hypothetical protein